MNDEKEEENGYLAAITEEEFRKQYSIIQPKYESLGLNLKYALEAFLKDIPYLNVAFRVKDVDSAHEKITRKKYTHPLEQIEDWCGMRIICYYSSDVDRIGKILEKEFDIKSKENTIGRLGRHEFGYRSTHYILTVKDSWMCTPNYRELEGLKAEIQVRTVSMHAWAEVEHKLNYKSGVQTPEQFGRKLDWLCAKFEEADHQFEELRKDLETYRASVKKKASEIANLRGEALNLDTLQAFADVALPEKDQARAYIAILLEELTLSKMTMSEVIDGYELAKDIIASNSPFLETLPAYRAIQQAGALTLILEVGTEKLFEYKRDVRKLDDDVPGWLEKVIDARTDVRNKKKQK